MRILKRFLVRRKPWDLFECNISGHHSQVLLNTKAHNLISVELPKALWFGVYGQLPPDGNFWHADETQHLDAIEDNLLALMNDMLQAIYVMRITRLGIREYFFHARNAENIDAITNQLSDQFEGYKIESDYFHDPQWHNYLRYFDYAKRMYLI